MSKSLSRMLFLIGLPLIIIGLILEAAVIFTQGNNANITLLLLSVIIMLIGSILFGISWIGALIRVAQLARWGWFVCLLIIGPIAMLGYVFAGPSTPFVSQSQ